MGLLPHDQPHDRIVSNEDEKWFTYFLFYLYCLKTSKAKDEIGSRHICFEAVSTDNLFSIDKNN
jgi:hypothetical protein